MRLQGILYFQNSITVKGECLGKQFVIDVAGHKGILATPTIDPMYANENSKGRFTSFELLCPTGLNKNFPVDGGWGVPLSWPTADSSLLACGFWFDVDEDVDKQAISAEIYSALSSWAELFKDNITTLSGQNLHLPRFGYTQTLREREEKRDLYYPISGTEMEIYWPPQIINVTLDQHCQITYAQFTQGIALTNRSKRPLLELYLLREANEALITGNLRKAILDAATAVELCLTNTIKANLRVDENLQHELLKNYNSITRKRQLLKVLQIELPPFNYQDDFETLRNKAIHIGKSPTNKEARLAVTIATAVISKLTIDKFEQDN